MLLGSLNTVLRYKIHPCDDYSTVDFISLSNSIFSWIVWIDKLHDFIL